MIITIVGKTTKDTITKLHQTFVSHKTLFMNGEAMHFKGLSTSGNIDDSPNVLVEYEIELESLDEMIEKVIK